LPTTWFLPRDNKAREIDLKRHVRWGKTAAVNFYPASNPAFSFVFFPFPFPTRSFHYWSISVVTNLLQVSKTKLSLPLSSSMPLVTTEKPKTDSELATQLPPTGISSPVFPTPPSPTLSRAKCDYEILLATHRCTSTHVYPSDLLNLL
jgi:hypothetical protein